MMKRTILLAGLAFAMLAANAQDNPYIVKTKNVKKTATKAAITAEDIASQDAEPKDFMGKNFRYYSMCDWHDGMRFMVMPEKYDLLVNTFRDANTNKEVSSARLRHHIMVYKGHEDMTNGRVHIKFFCETDNKNYYYELPSGTFDDYCFGKLGVPTLAYLGDVDKARELLMDQPLITRTQFFRIDTEYDGDGYQEVKMPKNKVVTVKAIGVGTRSFPVKIIVEDENGEQFYQNVAMSKTNSGLRDDEFDVDNAKFLFEGSFEFTGAEMVVSTDIKSYINKTVHTKYASDMSTKGSGKTRDVRVPRFTGFIIDEIVGDRNNPGFYTLTLRESETRRIYYKDIVFTEDIPNASKEDYFGYLFGMGEGVAHNTTLETRTAIREGRVIPGMTMEEVEMAVGQSATKVTTSDGITEWMYPRSNSILVVQFNRDGIVIKAGARALGASSVSARRAADQKNSSRRLTGSGISAQ
ncbi:MAG: hypothetical protein II404_09585 [Prevotella sp.]|nr:hypothetical protein [Prevotella sp.]